MTTETKIKERGILFSPPMVRALLGGRKTQTRRAVKPKPTGTVNGMPYWGDLGIKANLREYAHPPCPYGQPGDRLWVRERWRVAAWHEGEPILIEYEDGTHCEESGSDADYYGSWYERMMEQSADDCARAGLKPDDDGIYNMNESGVVTRWRPSLFMPRWASRITLEITSVRVERVQGISEADALAEGVEQGWRDVQLVGGAQGVSRTTARQAYAALWDSINSKKHPWASNPWVWVIEFRKVAP